MSAQAAAPKGAAALLLLPGAGHERSHSDQSLWSPSCAKKSSMAAVSVPLDRKSTAEVAALAAGAGVFGPARVCAAARRLSGRPRVSGCGAFRIPVPRTAKSPTKLVPPRAGMPVNTEVDDRKTLGAVSLAGAGS